MTLEVIDNLVLDRFGLATSVLGPSALTRAIKRRLRSLGLPDGAVTDYHALLEKSGSEREQLLELLVVPETWFFRDDKVWPWLVRHVTGKWMPAHSSATLRVLSLACATGEEPYSITMALTDGGLPPARLSVEALDISSSALGRADQAIYGRNSFRKPEILPSIQHHLEPLEGGLHRLKPTVTHRVQFAQANLHDPNLTSLLQHARYDIIFCRNVIIYFPKPLQQRVLASIHSLLADDGILFAGHSELVQFLNPDYASVGAAMTFAFRKRAANDRRVTLPTPRLDSSAGSRVAMLPSATPAAATVPGGAPFMPTSPSPSSVRSSTPPMVADGSTPASPAGVDQPTLEEAQRAADAGHLPEALVAVKAFVAAKGTSAAADFLQGVVHHAMGNSDEAEQHLRRTVYQQPQHLQALTLLSLLLEQSGDPAAVSFRRRAARVSSQSSIADAS